MSTVKIWGDFTHEEVKCRGVLATVLAYAREEGYTLTEIDWHPETDSGRVTFEAEQLPCGCTGKCDPYAHDTAWDWDGRPDYE